MALIEMEKIRKVYGKEEGIIHAVDGISLKIRSGEFVSIMGASGSGKTTLMNILGLLDLPSSGIYRLNGHPVHNLNDNLLSQIRNRTIGYVFQNFNLIPRLSAVQNVAMPLSYSAKYEPTFSRNKMDKLARAALKKVGLSDRASHSPDELSGGQRQRLAIARAIVNHPKILLADEPTGNLDSKTGAEILKLFLELNSKGVTIIMITHDISVANKAQRTIKIKDGRIEKGSIVK